MLEKLKSYLEALKARSKQIGDGELKELPKTILGRQLFYLAGIGLGGCVVIIITINIIANIKTNNSSSTSKKEQGLKIELANKVLDPDKMWRNHFEDKLMETGKKVQDKLYLIDDSLKKQQEEIERKNNADLSLMKQQLEFAKNELQEATLELKRAREEQQIRASNMQNKHEEEPEDFGNITSRNLANVKSRPKNSRQFIPETAYVQGVLLGGISVSTGALSSSQPVPVIIQVTGGGNLPANFDINLKTCRILGSSYGDLSSERAIVRAEVLSCSDPIKEEVITTKIAGMIFGDDGMGGIKGRVVQTSNKQLRNAFAGGILSGFTGAIKSTDQFSITGAGAISTKQTPFKDRLKDSTLGGLGSAGEKIADYYLKQAENMSPVLQIPAGSRVDVVFTKGVYLGSQNVQNTIAEDRQANQSIEQGRSREGEEAW